MKILKKIFVPTIFILGLSIGIIWGKCWERKINLRCALEGFCLFESTLDAVYYPNFIPKEYYRVLAIQVCSGNLPDDFKNEYLNFLVNMANKDAPCESNFEERDKFVYFLQNNYSINYYQYMETYYQSLQDIFPRFSSEGQHIEYTLQSIIDKLKSNSINY